ncbi:hypothetical protein ZHAS_00008878 [Anopheles sinensis]|uniref:Uncharacterized protein n=1 Tax=Anopheles sinensis TaxID=74873 RepID=A0A084VTJ1_ANOSI|nr:hypothetical protein ZHAS_00008878 [Anopheles sinensis]
MKPFRVCGEVHGIVESESPRITYVPLPAYKGCTNSCFEAGEFELKFWIDWCSPNVPTPSLLMNRHIQDVEFVVNTEPTDFYIFYGCSQKYRTKFMMYLKPTCSYDCLPLMSYSWNRSDLSSSATTRESPAKQSRNGKRVSIYRTTENGDQRSLLSRQRPNLWITLLLVAVLFVVQA